MPERLAAYLRAAGWDRWQLLQLERARNFTFCVFRPGRAYPELVAKLSTAEAAQNVARAEAHALERLRGAPAALGVPHLVHEATSPDGSYLMVETGAPGRPWQDWLDPDDGEELPRQLERTERWLAELQRVAVAGEGDDTLGTSGARYLAEARRAVGTASEAEARLFGAAERAASELHNLRAVPVHGDFWAGNILEERGALSIIDWNNFHLGGPAEDLFNFLSGVTFRYRKTAPEAAATLWEAFYGRSRLVTRGEEATFRALRRAGLDTDALEPMFVLFLVTRLAMPEFGNHRAWRAFTERYVAAGLPRPFRKGAV